MQHSQLQITYPDCPFVWDYNDLTRTFDVEYTPMLKEAFIDEIVSELLKSEEENAKIDMDQLEKDDIIAYISEAIEADDAGQIHNKITYHKVVQYISSSLVNLWLNFHCACYSLNVSSFLDSDYKTNVSWTTVSLVGEVKPKNDNIKVKRLIVSSSNSNVNPTSNSNSNPDARSRHRALFVRTYNPDADTPTGDIYDSNVTHPTLSSNITTAITPRVHQIELNRNTRYNAQTIRSNLLSEGKQRRLKNLPAHITNQQKRVDLSLKGISNGIVTSHNNVIKSLETSMDRNTYDMIDEEITIHKSNQIYRFSPIESGNIRFKSKKGSKVKFVTILRQNGYLSFSLNIINCL